MRKLCYHTKMPHEFRKARKARMEFTTFILSVASVRGFCVTRLYNKYYLSQSMCIERYVCITLLIILYKNLPGTHNIRLKIN